MQRDVDSSISNNDRAFIIKALKEECRLDGRQLYDFRKVKYQFSLDTRSATVTLGDGTRVMTVITAVLEAPYPDRPNEGPIKFNVEFSPMASPAFEAGRPGEAAVVMARLVERGLRQSRAVDQEALCVMAGRKVWALTVDVRILDHCGNLVDAACLSALAALLAFRKPQVSIDGGASGCDVVVHPPEEKDPLPLTLHHLPVAISFALFEDGDTVVMDPSLKEEAAMAGRLTVVMNTAREVCAVHKAEGVGLTTPQFMRCLRLAGAAADKLVTGLKSALEKHEVARVQARIRRHRDQTGDDVAQQRPVVVDDADMRDVDEAAEGLPEASDGAAESSSSSEEEESDAEDGGTGDDVRDGAQAGLGLSEGRRQPKPWQQDAGGDAMESEDNKDDVLGSVLSAVGASASIAGGGVARLAGRVVGMVGSGAARGASLGAGEDGLLLLSKRVKVEAGYDELEAIAAVIAGTAAGSGPEPTLLDAVKGKKGAAGSRQRQ
ncbi:MAG: hypothetical protein WDW36_005798 [Sanguina aurantia]